ncbi:hypothetical protein L873DRAFT_5954 [Choiromyces venosus 120613-1]|uniref:Secreted protein n=1 Tax=Choiromyces venosus 120613-1 TaxID=1336337 RepID=A0A3N4K9C0_9PEZI|nr:hypothetical protein L873DRAFT_5954 [Choiromyces venosus 120613-1]
MGRDWGCAFFFIFLFLFFFLSDSSGDGVVGDCCKECSLGFLTTSEWNEVVEWSGREWTEENGMDEVDGTECCGKVGMRIVSGTNVHEAGNT